MSKAIVKGNFTGQEGGNFPVDAETFQQLQDYIDAVAELSSMYIPSDMEGAILSGCELESSGTKRGAGWLVLKDVGLVPFDGGFVADGVRVIDESVDVESGGVVYPAYVSRRATTVFATGAKSYSWANIADRINLYEVKNNTMPVGSIVLFAGEKSQVNTDKWLPCDGRAVSKIEYAELFSVIGTRYNVGSVTSGTFEVPAIENVQTRTVYIIRAK